MVVYLRYMRSRIRSSASNSARGDSEGSLKAQNSPTGRRDTMTPTHGPKMSHHLLLDVNDSGAFFLADILSRHAWDRHDCLVLGVLGITESRANFHPTIQAP